MSTLPKSKSWSAQGMEAGIHVRHRRMKPGQAGIHQYAGLGVVDDVHVHRHQLALGHQVGNPNRR